MTETSALKYLSGLIITRSIQKVLAPIAAQVSQLIILNEAYERGDRQAFPDDLGPGATSIQQATYRLVTAAQEHASFSHDEILSRQVPGACELLTVAGQGMVAAAQRIHIEGCTASARKHLIRSAKDVLEATLKVFVVADDAEVRKMVKSANCVGDRLSVITAVKSMRHLVPAFKGLTESVMLLASVIDRRQMELSHPQQRQRLIVAMTTLKKCMPMLSTSLQTFCKYPNNEQAMSGRNYAIGQAMDALTEIIAAVENKDNSYLDDYEELEQPGAFISNVDAIMELLGEESTVTCADLPGELDVQVESAVRHCMAVAHIAEQRHRDLLVLNAQKVLHQRAIVTDLAKNFADNPDFHQLRNDFGASCDELVLEIQDLERHVNGAVLHLIVTTFKESVEPVERLVRAALKPIVDEEAPLEEIESQAMLQPFIDAFHEHSDAMCQVARLVAASSSNARKVRVIHGCIISLESLDPELVPATVACRRDIKDRAALEHLRLLRKEWNDNVKALVDAIDELTEIQQFISVSDVEIRESLKLCKQSTYLESVKVADVTRLLIGQANRVAQAAVRLINKNEDPIFRNGVMAFVKQLKKAIPAVKASANKVLNQQGDLAAHEKFHRRSDMIVKCVGKIQQALSGETELELLNPLRRKARQKIVDEEYHDLDAEDWNPDSPVLMSKPALSTYKAADSMAKLSKKAALKNYVADVVDSEVDMLCQAVVTAAVGGDSNKLNTACNDLLSRANHIVEISSSVANHCPQHQSSLKESARAITNITPEIVDKAKQVLQLDTQEVEPLHQIASQWAGLVTYSQGLIDSTTCKWKDVSEKVTESAKLKNTQLLAAQNQHLTQVTRQIDAIAATVLEKLSESTDLAQYETAHVLRDVKDDIANQTTMLTTLADIYAHSGSAEDVAQLEMAGREWAAKAYCIAETVDTLSAKAIKELDINIPGGFINWDNYSHTEDVLRQRTEDTVRIKGLLVAAVQGCAHPSKTREVHLTMAQLDTISGEMHDTCRTADSSGSSLSEHTDSLLYSHKMNMLLWLWALKMEELRNHLDFFTQDFQAFLESVIVGNDYDQLKIQVGSVKSRLERLLKQPGFSSQESASLSHHLDQLNVWTKRLIELPDNASGLRNIQQNWSATVLQLEMTLSKSKVSGAADAVKLLKLDDDKRKQAFGSLVLPKEIPESTGDLLADIRRAAGSAAVASSMSDRKSDGSSTAFAVARGNTSEYERLKVQAPVQHRRPEPPSPTSKYKPKSRADISFKKLSSYCDDVEQWDEENNEIVRVAKEMSSKLNDMAQYARNQGLQPAGSIQKKEDMISTAKFIALRGEKLVKFSRVLAKYCKDKSFAKDLMFYADHVPTVSTQLSILASVKAATPEDRTADKMLVKNSENLLDAISKMLSAAEAASVKGFNAPPQDATLDENEALVLAIRWSRKVAAHRARESITAETDELGLRRVDKISPGPTLGHYVSRK